jgi:hypothetical protein
MTTKLQRVSLDKKMNRHFNRDKVGASGLTVEQAWTKAMLLAESLS